MKNSKLHLITTIVTVVAILLTACGIGLYAIADTTPAPIVINNGDGTGKNTLASLTATSKNVWNNPTYVDNAVTGGKAITLTGKGTSTTAHNIKLNTSEVTNPKDVNGVSMYVEIPDIGKDKFVEFKALKFNAFYSWIGDVYVIDNNGSLIAKNNEKLPSGFKGTLVYVVPSDDADVFLKGTDNFTWDEFFDTTVSKGKISEMTINFKPDSSVKGKTLVIDEVTVHFDTAEKFMNKYNLLVNAPTSNKKDGVSVRPNTEITLSADEGCEIYYTLDGTTPDKTSQKYGTDNKPTITADVTLKTVAYNGEKKSTVSVFNYILGDPNAPVHTVLNDGSSLANFKANSDNATLSITSDKSPYGDAINYYGKTNSGDTDFKMSVVNPLDIDTMRAQEAVGFWVSVPKVASTTIFTGINEGRNLFKGKIITIDGSTHEVNTYQSFGEYPTFSNFQGYILLVHEDKACIQVGSNEANLVKWDTFVKTYGVTSLNIPTDNLKYYKKDFVFDNVIAVESVDDFISDVKKEQMKPMPPYAKPASDAVKSGTKIFLYSDAKDDIYYTLDGSTPTTDSTLYKTTSLGAVDFEESPITITEATTLKAIAVNTDGITSSIATYQYTIEPDYTGPNEIIINNGSGQGSNTFGSTSLLAGLVDTGYVQNDSPDGYGFELKFKSTSQVTKPFGVIAKGSEVDQIHNMTGYSFHVDIPATTNKANIRIGFAPRADGYNEAYLAGKMYAISDDGETVIQGQTHMYFTTGFKGTVYMEFPTDEDEPAVLHNFGKIPLSWKEYIKEYGLSQLGFYFVRDNCDKFPEIEVQSVVFDEFTLYYDMTKKFQEIGLDGMLSSYEDHTFENSKLIVTNDGSGFKKNYGIVDFSSAVTKLEASDRSFDEKCIKVTAGAGENFINFLSSSTDPELVICDGTAFWVEMPKGSGETTLGFELIDSDAASGGREWFEYNKNNYYLIDKLGVISKKSGDITLPDGFRGWVVIPKNVMNILQKEGYAIINADPDFDVMAQINIIFKNKNGELTGKEFYIDDISYYTNFADLAIAKAIKWDAPLFE